ncbi:MAG TPA: hypothetical protein VFA89_13560 [Terriglobales bacterium]|nr:hypothetical protein [Terriglobales bacterium]
MNPSTLMFCSAAVCLTALLASPAKTAADSAKSASHTGVIRLQGMINRVFPLFTPIEEKQWAPGWDPKPINPADGKVQEGMIFETDGPPRIIWVVTKYDPGSHEIDYLTLGPDIVRQLKIRCSYENGTTTAQVTDTVTAISDHGNDMVERNTQEKHEARIQHWEMAINHLLKTGKRIEEHQ